MSYGKPQLPDVTHKDFARDVLTAISGSIWIFYPVAAQWMMEAEVFTCSAYREEQRHIAFIDYQWPLPWFELVIQRFEPRLLMAPHANANLGQTDIQSQARATRQGTLLRDQLIMRVMTLTGRTRGCPTQTAISQIADTERGSNPLLRAAPSALLICF